ncbi:MAG: glycosyltransferase family 2 protein [Deltaproteobacteria bacterium]|nr:glycosyltransferase family 2 protein [Deltaproteobacteria bacterium]
MRYSHRISVIIPALNEATSIGKVISSLPPWVDDIIVVDNGSSDNTAAIARACGARVVYEQRRGYGSACLAGIRSLGETDIVAFLDGDLSDYPEEIHGLVDSIAQGRADLVIGSRILGKREKGALTPQARFGNWLSCFLIRLFWGFSYTDLGPFRAISCSSLTTLNMADPDYGWTVEMQVKAVQCGLRILEIPVKYRRRLGTSKISGTLKGVILAGIKILFTVFRLAILASLGTLVQNVNES